jgi:MFS family permease
MNEATSAPPEPAEAAEPRRNPRSAFRHRGFRLFWIARFLAVFSTQIVSVAVGWQVYDLTRNPFDLGLIGLVQFAPALMLVLVTGTVSDRYNRRIIVAICVALEAVCAAALLLLTWHGDISVGLIFAILFLFGVARAFMNPAAQSLIPNLVPPEDLAGAIALSASSWQVATIVGPVAGGLLYGLAAEAAYGSAGMLFLASVAMVLLVPRPPQKIVPEPPTWATVVAGFRYVWREKVVLGAISLDLFAVLLGGAVALLPAYARDILDVGPWGLGFLRSANGIGAVAVALWLAWHPVRDRAGLIMFAAVALFGVFTLVFGVSTIVWLSVVALALAGAADMISVYVRETLIQLWTPDDMRGRVNAVNMVFVGASNELGEFRAGSVAALIGVVPAVVMGGVGTIGVAALWAWLFPQLRKIRHLHGRG